MSKKLWWAAHHFEGTSFTKSAENPAFEDSWYGPFKTLAEAKRDAIAYHQATLDTAKNAIYRVRKFRAKDEG